MHPSNSNRLWSFAFSTGLFLVPCLVVVGQTNYNPSLLQLVQAGNGLCSLSITGNPGTRYQILCASSLEPGAQWAILTNVTITTSPMVFDDPALAASPKKFYRAVYNPNPDLLAWIMPGAFVMGSPTNEIGRQFNEGPLTTVTLTRGFYIGKYEVTQVEYQSVIGNNPSYFRGNVTRPVETVTWYQATNYCARLTQREQQYGRVPPGWAYRLPTEAEWEYACRAGTSTRFSYGDDPTFAQTSLYAWYYDKSDGTTHPVGGLLPNPWGLYDMHGNVDEWCLDYYADSYSGGNRINPRGPESSTDGRIRRGGSCWSGANACRSASRFAFFPEMNDPGIGFRVVLAPTQP